MTQSQFQDSLAAIYFAIYFSVKDSEFLKSIPEDEAKSLFFILNAISMIEETINEGYKETSIYQHLQTSTNNNNANTLSPLTQKNIMEIFQQSHKDMLVFLVVMIDKLQTDMAQTTIVNTNYYKGLTNVLDSIIDRINEQLSTKNQSTLDNFYMQNDFASYIESLGGRYLPFKQKNDPFIYTGEGACFGYARQYINEVKQRGYFGTFPHAGNFTFFNQNAQRSTLKQESANFEKWFNIKYDADVKTTVRELLQNITDKKIYSLTVHGPLAAHELVIRQIPNTSTYEVFDSNHGIIDFDDASILSLWLSGHLANYVFDLGHRKEPIKLHLRISGDQPINSKPSIPPLQQHNRNVIDAMKKLATNQTLLAYTSFSGHEINHQHELMLEAEAKPAQKKLYETLLMIEHALNQLDICSSLPEITYSTDWEAVESQVEAVYKDRMIRKNAYEECVGLGANNKQIIQKIDNEIYRLKNAWGRDESSKIQSLLSLKTFIGQTKNTTPLKLIISQWQRSKSQDSAQTNAEIIATHKLISSKKPTKTEEFINNLLQTEETSIYRLWLLRRRALAQASALLGSDCELTLQEVYDSRHTSSLQKEVLSLFKNIRWTDPGSLVALNKQLSAIDAREAYKSFRRF